MLQLLALLPYGKKVLYPSEFAHFPVNVWVLSGNSGFIPLLKDMLVKFISDSKLVAGVNVTMNGCLSLCQPCNRLADTELSRVYPAPL